MLPVQISFQKDIFVFRNSWSLFTINDKDKKKKLRQYSAINFNEMFPTDGGHWAFFFFLIVTRTTVGSDSQPIITVTFFDFSDDNLKIPPFARKVKVPIILTGRNKLQQSILPLEICAAQ